MGELHLEVIENRIKTEKGLEIIASPPIVVYRETVLKKSLQAEGKSPNKHNKFYFTVEPLDPAIAAKIKAGELPEGRVAKKEQELVQVLVSCGLETKEAKKVREVYKGSILVDETRGIVHIGEVMEMLMDAYEQVMNGGLLAHEPCVNLRVNIVDIKLHEDAIHRGPAQVLPAVRDGIREAMGTANPVIFEPVQIMQIEAPEEYLGELSKLIQNKRGQLLDMTQDGNHISIKAKIPVAEMFGIASEVRSATGGRGTQFLVDQMYERLPGELQQKVVTQIRQRKGLDKT